jgi:predicted lipoprotein with Yx(FWY)xxD motif
MRLRTTTAAFATVAVIATAAGCGGSSGDATSGAAASGGSSAAQRPASTSGPVTVKTATGPLGTFLVDGQGRTLYLWGADKGSHSTCDGACAEAWPPLTTTGAAKAAGGAKASLLGTTTRADGSAEVTYAGHPLYLYVGDRAPGDTTGQGNDGFGAEWYVLSPSGGKIDKD